MFPPAPAAPMDDDGDEGMGSAPVAPKKRPFPFPPKKGAKKKGKKKLALKKKAKRPPFPPKKPVNPAGGQQSPDMTSLDFGGEDAY